MNETQLELTRLIGKKSPTIGCKFIMPSLHGDEEIKTITKDGSFVGMLCEIIGHPATWEDFFKSLDENSLSFQAHIGVITIRGKGTRRFTEIDLYVSMSKSLLDQSPETLKQLIDLIFSYQ